MQTGNPNAHKITNNSVVGVPSVRDGREFVVRNGGLGNEGIGMLERRCGFWLGVAGRVDI